MGAYGCTQDGTGMSVITTDPNGVFLLGPLMVLSACLLSMVSSAIWSRNVGETSCGWRTDYSPDGRAFSIWGVIYVGTLVSVFLQVFGVLVFHWWVNLLWGLTWVCCAVWVPAFDAEYPSALRTAALVITLSSGFSLAGVWYARMWEAESGGERGRQVAVGWPLVILAAWLLTATSINWGIAWKASRPGSAASCVRVEPKRRDESDNGYRYRRRVAYREAYAKAPARVSVVPALLAAVVGGLSIIIPEPLLVLPLLWAIVNLKAFPHVVYVLSAIALINCSVVAFMRLYVWG